MWGSADGVYDRWAAFLERWARGEPADDAALPAFRPEDFATDTVQRFAIRVQDALNARLRMWNDALAAAAAVADSEFEVARALSQARTGLDAIRRLTTHPGLPAGLAEQLRDAFDREVRNAQRTLEDQAVDMRRSGASHTESDERLRTIRDNALTAVLAPPVGGTADGWAGAGQSARRRVIVDRPATAARPATVDRSATADRAATADRSTRRRFDK